MWTFVAADPRGLRECIDFVRVPGLRRLQRRWPHGGYSVLINLYHPGGVCWSSSTSSLLSLSIYIYIHIYIYIFLHACLHECMNAMHACNVCSARYAIHVHVYTHLQINTRTPLQEQMYPYTSDQTGVSSNCQVGMMALTTSTNIWQHWIVGGGWDFFKGC